MERIQVDNWDPWRKVTDSEVYRKYNADLFGLLVSLTAGEAKGILKSMLDSGKSDGFLAVVTLHKRYDAVTTGNLLQSYLEVVAPPAIKNAGEVVAGIHKWELKVA